MNKLIANLFENQGKVERSAKIEAKRVEERTRVRRSQPWQFRTDDQGRKWRLVRQRLRDLARLINSFTRHGCCFASVDTLAGKFGMSRRQTLRYLKELNKMGIVVPGGLTVEHGTRKRTINVWKLAVAPECTRTRASSNRFGRKKSASYLPAYAKPKSSAERESGTSGLRESVSPGSANLAQKYFIRRSGEDEGEYAVPEERTCELPPATSAKLARRSREIASRSSDRKSRAPRNKSLSENLATYIDQKRKHGDLEPFSEFLRFNPAAWPKSNGLQKWKANRDEWLSEFRSACETVNYMPDPNDPVLTFEFLSEMVQEVDKRKNQDISPARICMKIIDRCLKTVPTIPVPPGFVWHKDKLWKAEKHAATPNSKIGPNL